MFKAVSVMKRRNVGTPVVRDGNGHLVGNTQGTTEIIKRHF